jgi:hypothetical protein
MNAVDQDVQPPCRSVSADTGFSLKVLTHNIHKWFHFFSTEVHPPELREAVRSVGAKWFFSRK